MNPRIGWFKWIDTFKTRESEILDFKKRILKKDHKEEFDILYLNSMEKEISIAEKSIKDLKKTRYLDEMKQEILNNGFCHHDYANHNILIDTEGEINIIDFDYCILDTHLHDLASLLIRRMKNGKWNMNNASFIVDAYSTINVVKTEHIPIMSAFMEFPQGYWQLGIQYYWEKQPWGEEAFIKKLKRILGDTRERLEFIDEFKKSKYN
nr:TPA_exp: spore coat protein, CotS family [Clostridium autoethanogenum DSM 10061]